MTRATIGSWTLIVAGVGMLAGGLGMEWRAGQLQYRGRLNLAQETPQFNGAAGDECVSPVLLANDSNRELHVIGAQVRCYPYACLYCDGLPLTIPAGGRATMQVKAVIGPGIEQAVSYSEEFILYTDAPGQIEFPVTIKGAITPKTGEPDSTKVPGTIPEPRPAGEGVSLD